MGKILLNLDLDYSSFLPCFHEGERQTSNIFERSGPFSGLVFLNTKAIKEIRLRGVVGKGGDSLWSLEKKEGDKIVNVKKEEKGEVEEVEEIKEEEGVAEMPGLIGAPGKSSRKNRVKTEKNNSSIKGEKRKMIPGKEHGGTEVEAEMKVEKSNGKTPTTKISEKKETKKTKDTKKKVNVSKQQGDNKKSKSEKREELKRLLLWKSGGSFLKSDKVMTSKYVVERLGSLKSELEKEKKGCKGKRFKKQRKKINGDIGKIESKLRELETIRCSQNARRRGRGGRANYGTQFYRKRGSGRGGRRY